MLFKNKNVLGYAKLNMLEGSKKVLRWSIFLFIILGYFFFFFKDIQDYVILTHL